MLEFQRFIGFNRTTVECKFFLGLGEKNEKSGFNSYSRM